MKKIPIFMVSFFYFLSALYTENLQTKNTIENIFQNQVVKIFYNSRDFSKVYPWIVKPGNSYFQYGILMDKEYVLTQVDELLNSDKIEIENSFGERTTAKIIDYDLDVNLCILKIKENLRKNQVNNIYNLFGSDPKSGTQIKVYIKDDLNQASEKVFTVNSYTITSDYGFTKLPVFTASLQSDLKSGIPVFSENLIVGIFSYKDNKGNGVFVPASRLKRFQEIQSEKKGGFVSQGFSLKPIENQVLKEYYQLGERKGCFVTEVLKTSSAWGYLMEGDILISIDGIVPKEKCLYMDPLMGLQKLELLFSRKKNGEYRRVGDEISVKIIRNKQEKEIQIPLKSINIQKVERIPWKVYGPQKYFIFYGLVLVEFNRNYLWEIWGKDWRARAIELAYLYDNFKFYRKEEEQDKIILITEVIPDPINLGYQDIRFKPIIKVDNQKIENLESLFRYVMEKLKNPLESNFIVLELTDRRKIFLDLSKYNESLNLIKKISIPKVSSFDN